MQAAGLPIAASHGCPLLAEPGHRPKIAFKDATSQVD